MENLAATLHCPNPRCQAPNPQSNRFCQKCRTPLLRRYLWAIGQEIEAAQPGEVIGGRYIFVRQRIFLDSLPGMPPEMPLELPKFIMPYLRLSPYGLHIPRVYGRLMPIEETRSSEIWLLEEAPLYTDANRRDSEEPHTQGQLLPELFSVWQAASPIRQLNWLWQLASLWQPLSSEGVASSLLSPVLLRAEGSIVRLLELQFDHNQTPTLQQLGQLWTQLLAGASPVIGGFLQQLCEQLVTGQLQASEDLITQLDQALRECGRSQSRTYEIYTRTDTGPSRYHNEDACYPSAGQLFKLPTGANALAIVCDGIGGHEGGEVASRLAIDTLRERVENLPTDLENWNPSTLTEELEEAACAANDLISQQNDLENRSERQRMGTTLVMAQTSAHEMYITHVGDSRVYWVTRNNCHQVTLDDDLASREVRLGYALYRYAIQQPTSGSLVQALGMAPSTTLHPTVQRFVIDEDCVFLLCSDGLSDNDRVEQYWQTEILPILEGQIDLTTAGSRLIQLANTQNGHDNVTIALIHCKVQPAKQSQQIQLSQLDSLPTTSAKAVATTLVGTAPSHMKTQQLPVAGSTRRPWGLLLGILLLVGLGGGLASIWFGWIDQLISFVSHPRDTLPATSPAPPSESSSPTVSLAPSPVGTPSLEPGQLIKVSGSSPRNSQEKAIRLVLRSSNLPQNNEVIGVISAGSVLQVINASPDQVWVQLRVCTPGNVEVQQPALAQPSSEPTPTQAGKSTVAPKSKQAPDTYAPVGQGVSGWIRKGDILPNINSYLTSTPDQQSVCVTPTISATATPTPSATPSP